MEKNASHATKMHFPFHPGEALDEIQHTRVRWEKNCQLYMKKLNLVPVSFLQFVIKQGYINHTDYCKQSNIHGL